jgi:outer membrane murein-binding lipoprotein Lpp
LSHVARFAAPCAAIALSACAGGGGVVRADVDALRAEVASLHQQNAALARRVDALAVRLEASADRPARPVAAAPAEAPPAADPLVPPDLAVVRVAPPRGARPAPPIATAVRIAEPDPERLDDLAKGGGRELAAEADGELAAARRRAGVDRAHALEAFVTRYPRHPSADNALVEAARDYQDAGRLEAGCELARRVPEDYPAGDAVAGALEFAARCERSRP